MHRAVTITIIAVASILIIVSAGCYDPGGPVPEGKHRSAARAWTAEDVDAAVSMAYEQIYSSI